MTDIQKLNAYAYEVFKMRQMQKRYFTTVAKMKKNEVDRSEVINALNASKDAEKRVDTLTSKIMAPQMEIS